ncbi:MAG TPA: hypothetical protein VEJ87_06345 [Acidimicrobiales bacterium]|nr:hypothetical protein [Acidimicrobiales bacterium]
MKRRIDLTNIDLDEVATEIDIRRGSWTERGLDVRPFTWTENDEKWPTPLLADRSEVRRPRSLGVRVLLAEQAAVELVVYAGGWADLTLIPPGGTEPEFSYIEVVEAADVTGRLDEAILRISAAL